MFLKVAQNIRKLISLILSGKWSSIALAIRSRMFALVKPPKKVVAREYQNEVARVLLDYFDCDNTYRPNTIKVALVLRAATTMPQSSAFIRLIAPLTHPSIKSKISIQLYPDNTLTIDDTADICIVQRTAFDRLSYARKFVSNIKASRTKLIVDTDDAFDTIEPGHSQYKEQLKRIGALKYISENADEVWLSTKKLYQQYSHPKKVLMENTLDERLWRSGLKSNSKKLEKGPIRILYAGTATHGSDFDMVKPALDKLNKNNPGSFNLTIIGVSDKDIKSPWAMRIKQPKFKAMYPNFVKWLIAQGPFDIGLSPLEDTAFNSFKSDIKCLDYLAAGIIPVVSDLEPYQSKEIDSYIIKVNNTVSAWTSELEKIVQNPDVFRKNKRGTVLKAQHYIWSKRSSKKAAQKILKQITNLKI